MALRVLVMKFANDRSLECSRLSDVLKLVINGFNKCPFAKHNLVGDGHQRVLHVVLDLGNKLNAVHKQKLI